MHPAPRHRPTLRAATMAAALAMGHTAAMAQAVTPATSASTVLPYEIAAGPLGQTLVTIAQRNGITISMDPALVDGLQAPAVRGSYTPEQAVQRALAGHPLVLMRTGNGVLTLRKGAPALAASANTLGEVRVTAQAQAAGVTENSGAYTSSAAPAATGLALSARETPQSVSVMTRQQLDDLGVQSVQEVLHHAPGITSTQLDSERHTFYARGFSIDNFQYDGVPTQFASQYGAGETEVDSVLYDRVEIVRGATGLLTGAGDPSAAINLVRKRANSKVFTGTLAASAASWDNYRASADLSAPLTQDGRIRARVVAASEDKKSFIDGYRRKRQTLYGALDAELTSATTLSLGASYQQGRAQGVTYGGFPLYYSNGGLIDWRSRGRSFSIWPKWSTEDTDSSNAFAQLEHRWANGWKTTAQAMYSRQEVENTRLFPWDFPDATTGLMASNPSRVQFPGARQQRSLDLRSAGPFEAFGRRHEAIVGFSHSRQQADFDRIGAADAASALSLFDWARYPAPGAWGSSVKSETYDRRQTGAYGAVRWSLSDPLHAIIGGRLNRWDRSGAGYMGRNPYETQQTKFTPYAGLVYDLDPQYSVYGSFTSIYNPQNYRSRAGDFLDPVEGRQWETGVKGEFLGGRVQASAALFHIQQDNLAQTDPGQYVPNTTTQAYIGARGVRSKGVELELHGELQPGWNLSFSAAHFKATDAGGNDVNMASPRSVLRLYTSYRLPGAWQGLTVGGGVNWQSKTVNPTGVYHGTTPRGSSTYGQDAYALASLMARYQFTPQLSLQLNIDNLFDKWYYTSVNFNEQLMWGAPRAYRASMTYKF